MTMDSYVHNRADNGPGKPLLFLFHGTGGDENQFREVGRALLPGGGLVAPRGDISEQGAARYFRRASEGVYDMDDLARATGKMAAFIHGHVAAARPSAVLGLGYSNGANILASVMFANPDLFDAAVLMHPLIPFRPEIDGKLRTSVLITAGRADPICPPELTVQLEALLKDDGAPVVLDWHSGGHEIRKGEIDSARSLFSAYVSSAEEQTT